MLRKQKLGGIGIIEEVIRRIFPRLLWPTMAQNALIFDHDRAEDQVLFSDLKRHLPLCVNAFRFNQQTLINSKKPMRRLELLTVRLQVECSTN